MTPADESDHRVWARTDRSKIPPQRSLAQQMRKQPTDAERKLWWHLRHRLPLSETHFRRQVQIGGYIADFASHTLKLVIEVDGGQHTQQVRADRERTKVFEKNGYRVLRYWNNDVLSNTDGVLKDIQRAITSTPTPDPSPQGGGEDSHALASPHRGGE